jgi:preprotein translocase SecF subunit
MTHSLSRWYLVLVLGILSCLIALSAQRLASQVRFGLEFRGGYEIYYAASPAVGKTHVSADDMLATAKILRQRADSIGMAEPEIHIEGENHIRVKLAGLTSAGESRSLLGSAQGLPTVLTEKYTQTVGSVLGNTALKETMTAGAIGIACIFFLLLVLYRGVGVLAAFSTLVYLWLLVIVFNATHATLSLSAVVAFVLGIGMAADASIICFERIKEELSRGLEPAEAVRLGFAGSFSTIRDANLVTALAMGALFVAGIGPIQGFSLTMLASIVIGVGTNFFLVRMLCLWLAQSKLFTTDLLIGGKINSRGRKPRVFDFVSFGKTAIVISALTIVSGALYYRAHGLNLDIDFTAGTALDIDLDRAIDQNTATRVMSDAGTVPATVAIGGKGNEHIAARFDEILQPAELKRIIAAFQAKYQKVEYEENTADPGVAHDFATRAIYAVAAAFVSILLYIGLRFSWSIALATLAPIFHDILIVSAIFSLFKLEIDVTYIAALLTIIGYSLNDKIVIFGRVRENLKLASDAGGESLRELVNRSIRQTLGRSIYTVLTVVLASACLYLFACEPLQMFALAILLGLVSGAYSSIFISSVLWLSIHARVIGSKAFNAAMKPHLATRSFIAAMSIIVALGVSGWFAIPRFMPMKAAQAALAANLHGATLGDLAPFSRIASDSLTLVQRGDLKAAKARIKDLETDWDDAEKKLRPMSPNEWKAVDKAIDRALAQLRAKTPDAAGCAAALKTLIDQMDSLQPSRQVVSKQGGPLGDLTAFEKIAQDTLTLVEKSDFITPASVLRNSKQLGTRLRRSCNR